MPSVHCTIACNLDRHILTAALPLFQESKVEAIEWAFDSLYQYQEKPLWFEHLLQTYGSAGRLVGHGIYFSIFSGYWSAQQEQWLQLLKEQTQQYNFDHITEHFGFMTGKDFHAGAPLSVPYTPTTLRIGQDRLRRLQEASQCPVGLENLAFAYTKEQVWQQGDFLDRLLQPVNGFIILDLHNFYCQLANFDLSFEELIQAYPLERVRELHISGGSWEKVQSSPEKPIRRDTHDDKVPEEVFSLLKKTLPLVANLKYVVLEQLGSGLKTKTQQNEFRSDYLRMKAIVDQYCDGGRPESRNSFGRTLNVPATKPEQSLELCKDQQVLSQILEDSETFAEAQSQLLQSRLARSAWQVESWSPEMLETALQIAQKWKNGFSK